MGLRNVMEFERKLDWFSDGDRPRPQHFDGLVTALQLQEGLGLHTLNATARQKFEVDGTRAPGAVLHCFLEGSTDARLDGQPMHLGRRAGDPVRLVLTSIEESQRFTRKSDVNEYVRKVSIQMSHDWLDMHELKLPGGITQRGNRRFDWLARSEDIADLERLATTPGFTAPVVRLQAEALSLGLVARCFEVCSEREEEGEGRSLTPREHRQLRRIEDLALAIGPLPSLQQLALEGGLSQSGLRRLIKTAHGRTPLEHVRHLRLVRVRAGLETGALSVERAAEQSGYSSATNFATAFRRTFGLAPSQVKKRRKGLRVLD